MGEIVREDNVHIDDVNGIAIYDHIFAEGSGGKYSGILLNDKGKVAYLLTINPTSEEIDDESRTNYKDVHMGELPSGTPVILDTLEYELGDELPNLPEFIAMWLQDKGEAEPTRVIPRDQAALASAHDEERRRIISHSKQLAKHLSLGEQSPESVDHALDKLAEQIANHREQLLAKHLGQAFGRIHPNLFSEQLSPELLTGLIHYYSELPKSAIQPDKTG